MNTRELIDMLAIDAAQFESNANARRFRLAAGWGASGAMLVMLLQFGVRHDIVQAALLPMFWIKLWFVVCIAASGLLAATRLARPGARVARAPAIAMGALLVVWGMAAWMLAGVAASERSVLMLGKSWDQAPFNIAILSIPALAAAFWALKGLAPTRLSRAGAAAGLFAGGIGAIAYSFHCDEMAAPFIGIWYPAGVLLPVAVGAVLGPILLRW